MLRSHHHLRGFTQTSLLCEWMLVYPVGYVDVGFEGNCDCRCGILYASMLGGAYQQPWSLHPPSVQILCTVNKAEFILLLYSSACNFAHLSAKKGDRGSTVVKVLC